MNIKISANNVKNRQNADFCWDEAMKARQRGDYLLYASLLEAHIAYIRAANS